MMFLFGLDPFLAAIAGVVANLVGWTPVGRPCSIQMGEGPKSEVDRIVSGQVVRVLSETGRITGATSVVVKLTPVWHPTGLGIDPVSEILLKPRFAGHGAARLLFSDSLVNGYRVTASSTNDDSRDMIGIFQLHLGHGPK